MWVMRSVTCNKLYGVFKMAISLYTKEVCVFVGVYAFAGVVMSIRISEKKISLWTNVFMAFLFIFWYFFLFMC